MRSLKADTLWFVVPFFKREITLCEWLVSVCRQFSVFHANYKRLQQSASGQSNRREILGLVCHVSPCKQFYLVTTSNLNQPLTNITSQPVIQAYKFISSCNHLWMNTRFLFQEQSKSQHILENKSYEEFMLIRLENVTNLSLKSLDFTHPHSDRLKFKTPKWRKTFTHWLMFMSQRSKETVVCMWRLQEAHLAVCLRSHEESRKLFEQCFINRWN